MTIAEVDRGLEDLESRRAGMRRRGPVILTGKRYGELLYQTERADLLALRNIGMMLLTGRMIEETADRTYAALKAAGAIRWPTEEKAVAFQ